MKVLVISALIIIPWFLSCISDTQNHFPVIADNQSMEPQSVQPSEDSRIYTIDSITVYNSNMEVETINKKTTFDFSDPNKEYVVMNIP